MWVSFLAFLKQYESVAVWIEGLALVAIFCLDFSEYKKQGKDRDEQHQQTFKQMQLIAQQAEAASGNAIAAQLQADAALQSFRLSHTQRIEEQHRELLRAISALDYIRLQVRYWADISDSKWGSVNAASRILVPESDLVLIQAGRHSTELRNEAREAFRMLANADVQISQFYAQAVNYRQTNLIEAAHLNLVNAEPKLTHMMGVFEQLEFASPSGTAI